MAIVTRDRIQEVIHCSWWQAWRLSMKGVDTSQKLHMCQEWLESDDACRYAVVRSYNSLDKPIERKPIIHVRGEACGWTERRDQVLNYLTALSRGGQIERLAEGVYHDATVAPLGKNYGDIN